MKPLPVNVLRSLPLNQQTSAQVLIGLGIFLSLCAILYFGREILIPAVLAVLLSMLLAPAVRLLQQIRIPKPIAVIGVVLLTLAVLLFIAALVARALTSLAADLPRYEANLREKAHTLQMVTASGDTFEKAANVLKELQTELSEPSPTATSGEREVQPIPVEVRDVRFGPLDPVISVTAVIIHPLTQLGIVLLLLTFILFNREDLRNRLIRLAGTSDIPRTTVALNEAGQRLSLLFLTQLALNAGTGAFLGVALFLVGVPGALLWGILTAVLRFIPYVGTLLASILPIIIALAVGEGWTLAIITLGIVLITEAMVGHVLEPLFFGKMTGLSPIAIVLSAAFWTAIWGPIGLLLATPLTIGLLVVGRNIEALNFFEVLLGNDPVLTPDHAFYQRMLAGDPIEAAEQSFEFEKEDKLDAYLTEVAVPGLLIAHHDQLRGALSKERANIVAQTFSETLDEVLPEHAEEELEKAEVLLVSGHGALNFCATLAVSALLHIKGVPHRMLPVDAISPGKFPAFEGEALRFVCVCYLVAPSEAQHNYVSRRIARHTQGAKILGLAWSGSAERAQMLDPAGAVSLLPIRQVSEDTFPERALEGAEAAS